MKHAKLELLASAQVFSSSHTTAKRGVVVLIKNNIMVSRGKFISDEEGSYMFVTEEIEEQHITLINVYNLPGKGTDLMKRILSLLMTDVKGTIIMRG